MCELTTRTRPDWLPFARLNLLRNPFGQLSRADRVAAAIVETERWKDQLKDSRCALQFLGDCGRGKSTHLLAILADFPLGAYVYLPEDEPHPPLPQGCPLFIDEAQRLSAWQRYRAFRRGVPLALGTHRDLRASLERAGYHVQTFDVSTFTSLDRVHRVLNRRIELARLGPGEVPTISPAEVAWLSDKFGDDLRSMEDHLYETFQSRMQQEHGPPWPSVI